MSKPGPVILAAMLTLLLAAALPGANPATRPSAPTAPKKLTLDPGKPLVHAPSGFEFPFNVGAFRRAVAYTFDDAGENLSVGYSDPSLKIILTVYVYLSNGLPLDVHFKQTKAEVTQVNRTAKLAEDGSITIQHGKRGYEGLRARYQLRGMLGGVEQDLVSEAYLFVSGRSFVKFRLTYPAADAKAAATRVEFFLKTLAFPELPATKPAPGR
ncbi:hypothetical protein [Humisphaera borealis]|uniref:DUF1795 domain-containing protein n=1 Tax=Humisphaera borealis TaxID=2807512 RepID=A0A7M2X597_9BACT|nr:hypothetical protein [Humisphaera borealis]QOV92221.1 hypothetical protein IPV69_13035 [Humisphaera borealis]